MHKCGWLNSKNVQLLVHLIIACEKIRTLLSISLFMHINSAVGHATYNVQITHSDVIRLLNVFNMCSPPPPLI